ncbi:hypothetical protein OFO10_03130 [Campylobacter sp. VBCF_06 NA8]|uniref:hypothetical protein n=1 Tax=Campylobacter sp. VBCF_06 NA8 TaxID=2983822 RepID=UPI0022E9FF79|nr:hypothetical protein [Campylobacter sp. VBCF_06 NA8]MDA3046145.1 hypothetical protein [Campylobacter sp. VBCF_06 NA8]
MWKFFLGLGVGAIAGVGALAYVKTRCEEDAEFAEKVDDILESVYSGFESAKNAIESTASNISEIVDEKCEEIDKAFGWGEKKEQIVS